MILETHGRLAGCVVAAVSKSDLHRLLIATALSQKNTVITGCTLSQDIEATAQVLRCAGAEISFAHSNEIQLVPLPHFAKFPSPLLLDCGESGSTLRFLLPVMAALSFPCLFTGHGRLPERPMAALLTELLRHGVVAESQNPPAVLPLCVSGKLTAGEYVLPGTVSSQYISGLLFALPLLEEGCVLDGGCVLEREPVLGSKLRLSSPLESQAYVQMTLDVLKRFGISVTEKPDGWDIPSGQSYHTPGNCVAEGDWSNAAFWICAAAISGSRERPIVVKGLNPTSLQGDKEICTILQEMGAELTLNQDQVSCSGGALHGIAIDGAQIPDIIPILAVVAAVAAGETRIYNAGRLRIKESDRLAGMAANLLAIGAELQELPDGLLIKGKRLLNGGSVDSYHDHRIAMAMAVASLRCQNPVRIKNPACVAKSYPAFYEDFKQLGGEVRVIDLGESA